MKRPVLGNRRVRPRIDVQLQAKFRVIDESQPARDCLITNISVSGAAVYFPGMPEGSLVKEQCLALDFTIPGTSRHIDVQGEIVWLQELENGVAAGVNFLEPVSFEEIMKCCFQVKKDLRN